MPAKKLTTRTKPAKATATIDHPRGAIVGYARVSSAGQSLTVQRDGLRAAGCTKVFEEKRSGLDGARPELARCLEYLREGDVLVITKLDRLARSALDLGSIAKRLEDQGVGFRVLDQGIDTTTPVGKLTFHVLAAIAEFETAIRKERQMEGIAKAKERGVRFGREAKLSEAQVEALREKRRDGVLIKALMAEHGLSKAHIYRLLGGSEQADAPTVTG